MEVTRGFGRVHLDCPEPIEVPDVFYQRFLVHATKWDSPTWDCKERPCDDGNACGVNAALAMHSHVDCSTLDRVAATAAAFVRLAEDSSPSLGDSYGTIVFDHDQA